MRKHAFIGLSIVIMMIAGIPSAAAKPPATNNKQKAATTVDPQLESMSNILSANSGSLKSKLAIAMAGESSDFVLGHGSGGMGFRGTGTGGGSTGGFGRIRGLSKTSTKEVKKPTGRLKIGEGTVTFKPTKEVARRTPPKTKAGKVKTTTRQGKPRGLPCNCPCQ